MQVCRKLWASWDDDAVVMDRAAASSPIRARSIASSMGRFFKSRGPLNVVPLAVSMARHPAGRHLGKGRDFAARYADAVFAIQPTSPAPRALYDDIKRGVSRRAGRRRACKMLFGVQPIIGPRARGRGQAGRAQQPGAAGEAGSPSCRAISISTSVDAAARHHHGASQRAQAAAHADALSHHDRRAADTCARWRRTMARASGLPQMVGTPGDVADQLEAYFDQVGGDGFMLSPIYSPGRDRGVRRPGRAASCSAAVRFRRDYSGNHPARPPRPGRYQTGVDPALCVKVQRHGEEEEQIHQRFRQRQSAPTKGKTRKPAAKKPTARKSPWRRRPVAPKVVRPALRRPVNSRPAVTRMPGARPAPHKVSALSRNIYERDLAQDGGQLRNVDAACSFLERSAVGLPPTSSPWCHGARAPDLGGDLRALSPACLGAGEGWHRPRRHRWRSWRPTSRRCTRRISACR
jgi:alkanesulfonate monooxygenase SsuD/methylene tetrahydromethanopterin reductase-like flavin-dependent oxidoreductase (luciferase family)